MLRIDSKLKQKLATLYLRFFNLRVHSVFIGRGSTIRSRTCIGRGSRINGSIIIKGRGEVVIGKYCAIGDNVRIITSNHDVQYLNMQYDLQRKIGSVIPASGTETVTIGNNVWIGDSVIFLPGSSAGNGSVIGSGSIVTKPVDEFGIYAGNPARFIRKRFSEDVMSIVRQLDWWNWDMSKIKDNKVIFSDKADKHLDAIRKLAGEENEKSKTST